jgi:hypothetical protein
VAFYVGGCNVRALTSLIFAFALAGCATLREAACARALEICKPEPTTINQVAQSDMRRY